MRAYVAHLAKDVRDQRAVLLGLLAALPLLTVLGFWAFADRVVEAPAVDAGQVVLPIALLLFVLAVVGDLVAGEVRGGTLALLRRTPGAMRAALLAKVTILILGTVVVLVWQALCLDGAWWLWGRSDLPSLGAVCLAGVLSPIGLPALLLAPWVLLASTWLRHGGVAVLLAPLLAGALVAPAFVWVREHRALGSWLLRDAGAVTLGVAAAAFAGVALLAAAASFLRGRRVVGPSWSAVWRGLVVVGLAAVAAYGYGAARLAAMLAFDPGDEGVYIHSCQLAPSGRTVWVSAARVAGDRDGRSEVFGPSRAWRIDLVSGRATPFGAWGEGVTTPPMRGVWNFPGSLWSSLSPQVRLVAYRRGPSDDRPVAVWLDTEDGTVLKVVPSDLRTSGIRAWLDEARARATLVRDAEGRRVWLRSSDSAPCRVGASDPPVRARPAFQAHWGIPGGWGGMDASGRRRATLDATTGQVRLLDLPALVPVTYLSPASRLQWVPARDREEGGAAWAVIDLDRGEQRDASAAPAGAATVLGALGSDLVLLLVCDGRERRLEIWDPVRGHRRAPDWAPSPPPPVETCTAMGWSAEGELAVVLTLEDGREIVRLDPASGRATRLGAVEGADVVVFALTDEGAAFTCEEGRRIVRYGPHPGTRTVLFPR